MPHEPVLIVEDNEINLKLERELLNLEGFEIRTASDAEEALEVLKSFRPRLILMDLQLPGMDGLELTRKLKANPSLKDCPIVAITAYAMKGDEEKARAAGCDGYITKPIDTHTFGRTIAGYLEGAAGGKEKIELPASAQEAPAKAWEECASAGVRRATILVIEDNPITRKMTRVTLETEGYGVLEAEDGKSALEEMQKSKPDLILQDLGLPDINGFELVKRLKASLGAEEVPIVAFTGLASQFEQAQFASAGFTDFIIKPAGPSRILQVIESNLIRESPVIGVLGRGRRVLVVDDDPLQLKFLKLQLASLGFRVETAIDGAEALEKVRGSTAFDAVVSDILMPNLDGFELCLSIRRLPGISTVPVILTTSALEQVDLDLAKKVGANACVARSPHQEEAIEALLASLEGGGPLPQAVEELKLKESDYSGRIMRQLKRRAALSTELAQRSSFQAAALFILGEIAESLAFAKEPTITLKEILSQCLDPVGLSSGALYLIEEKAGLQTSGDRSPLATGVVLRTWVGFEEREPLLADFFGHPEFFEKALRNRSTLFIPSSLVDEGISKEILKAAGAASILLMPMIVQGNPFGILLLHSKTKNLAQGQWPAFAHTVGSQIAQSLALARAFSQRKEAEKKLEEQAQSLQEANQQLQGLSRLKDEFLDNVTHELRTPLAAIKAGVDLFLDGVVGSFSQPQTDLLRLIDGSCMRLARLIDQMLDLTKIKSGHLRIFWRRLSLKASIEKTLEELKTLAVKRTLKLEASSLPDVFADPDKICQILTNLLSNAVKFTKEDGTITITLREEAEVVAVTVQDDGVGIAPEDLPKLFERFSQVGEYKAGGTGLGLALCRELVELHKGTISVTSEPGKGSCFTFTLPLYTPEFALEESFKQLLKASARFNSQATIGMIVIDGEPLFQDSPDRSSKNSPELLEGLSGFLRQRVKSEDVVLTLEPRRVVIMAVTDLKGIQALPERVRGILKEWAEPQGLSAKSSQINIGAAFSPLNGQGVHDLLSEAIDTLSLKEVPGAILKRILLADDEPSTLEVMKLRLEKAGFGVVTATDGEEVLTHVMGNKPIDLILLDIKMPRLDGIQVMKKLKMNPSTRNLPVIAFTGCGHEIVDQNSELGFADFLTKPFGLKELFSKINRALGAETVSHV